MRKIILISSFVVTTLILALILTAEKNSIQTAAQTSSPTPQAKHTPYVLQANEGENIGRGGLVKVSSQTGAKNISMVMTQLPKSKKIFVHRHEHDEEVFFVHKGKGHAILDEQKTSLEEGSVIYIPPGTWHGVEADEDMQLVWTISPPHFVDLYRLFFKPGFEPTKEEEERLFKKHGYQQKPPQ